MIRSLLRRGAPRRVHDERARADTRANTYKNGERTVAMNEQPGDKPGTVSTGTTHVHGQVVYVTGTGHNEPPQFRMATAAFMGGLGGGLLGALLCALLRGCGCG